MADIEKLIAEMEAGLDGVTLGPWKVIETLWPWRLEADERPPRSGNHCERTIATVANHPQSHAPWAVVTCATGVGLGGWKNPAHFVRIAAEDADHIARCSPDNIRALLDLAKEGLAARAQKGEA